MADETRSVLNVFRLHTAHGAYQTALSRDFLVEATQLPDRSVRAAIQELRGLGYPIYSAPSFTGYRFAKDEQEVLLLAERFERMGRQHLMTASRLRQRYTRHLPDADPVQDPLL